MVTLERASARQILALQGELRSPRTTQQYATVHRLLARHLSARLGRPATVADLTEAAVHEWVAHVRAGGLGKETARQYLSVVKRWSAFCARVYRWPADPLRDTRIPSRTVRPVEVFTEAEVARMLDAIARGHADVRLRNRAAILIMLDTGLRVSELCDLDVADVTWPTRQEDGRLRVRHGKGDKPRDAPLRPTAAATASPMYIADERPGLADKLPHLSGDRVFLSSDGRPWTRQAAWKLVQDLGGRAGVEGKRLSPHTFRATFATFAALYGNSPYRLQDALGHADQGTTSRYIAAAELRKTPFVSPLERWRSVR